MFAPAVTACDVRLFYLLSYTGLLLAFGHGRSSGSFINANALVHLDLLKYHENCIQTAVYTRTQLTHARAEPSN